MADADDSLALRAAWLHFVAGMTQSAVAKRLGLPSVKAHRLIAKAVADGAVKVTIDGASPNASIWKTVWPIFTASIIARSHPILARKACR